MSRAGAHDVTQEVGSVFAEGCRDQSLSGTNSVELGQHFGIERGLQLDQRIERDVERRVRRDQGVHVLAHHILQQRCKLPQLAGARVPGAPRLLTRIA